MTHTLHRLGTREDLRDDFVFLSMPARGINDDGCTPALREVFKIFLKHKPVSAGQGKAGNTFEVPEEELVNKVTDEAVMAVYTDPEVVKAVLRDLKEADLGMSVVVSGDFEVVHECCRAVGIKPHSVDQSLGIMGRLERLPERTVLRITTMCGHHMVAPGLVFHLLERIRSGHLSVDGAAAELARQCQCGVFNPKRAARILQEMINSELKNEKAPSSEVSTPE